MSHNLFFWKLLSSRLPLRVPFSCTVDEFYEIQLNSLLIFTTVLSQAWRPIIDSMQASRRTCKQTQTRNVVAGLGLRGRGCRAGNHYHRRLLATQRVTSYNQRRNGFIPTVTFICYAFNNSQIFTNNLHTCQLLAPR